VTAIAVIANTDIRDSCHKIGWWEDGFTQGNQTSEEKFTCQNEIPTASPASVDFQISRVPYPLEEQRRTILFTAF
jgi:hypothetical protein